jgi:release factor glutamine methyltransferase
VRISQMLAAVAGQFKEAGIPGPFLDAELLVSHATGIERVRLRVGDDRDLDSNEERMVRRLAARRLGREPIAYLTGRKEFYSLEFAVNRDVLIPRPETELLVDLAIYYAPQKGTFVDIGTGSGAIAVAVKHARRDLDVHATDISGSALSVARRNASRLLGKNAIRFHRGDLFRPLAGMRFSVMAVNPPYVDREKGPLQPELAFEPEVALFAGGGGRAMIEQIMGNAGAYIDPDGVVIMEIGEDMDAYVKIAGAARGFAVSVLNDYAGLPRVAIMKK